MPIVTKKAAPVLFYLLCLLAFAAPARALDVGDAAKDFALPDASGTMVTLNEITSGAPATLVEFLSAYCEACRKKAPYMNDFYAKHSPRGLRMMDVALANDQQEAAGIVSEWKIPYPVLPDPEKKTFYLYGIHKVPQIFVIDGSGTIRYKGNGDDRENLEKVVEGLLAGGGKAGGQGSAGNPGEPVKPGDKAPEITLATLKGAAAGVQLSDDISNHILAFFSDSEQDNRDMARMLCSLAGQGAPGIRIYGILPGAMEKTGAGLAGQCAGLQVLVDRQGEAFGKFGVTKAPEIIILSRSGYIRRREAPHTAKELADLLQPAIASASTIGEKQLAEYLRQSIPGASSIRPIRLADGQTVYLGDTAKGKRLARVVRKEILCEVCTDVFYIMTIDEKGLITNITLVKPFELYGKPIDAGAFTRQFIGKSLKERFTAGRNADAITGATKSCGKFIEGINETEDVLSSLRKPPFDAAFRETVCNLNQGEIETALLRYQHEHPGSREVDIKGLAPLCPGGKLPQCPQHGEYRLTVFNGIARALCTVHGLDPRSSMIH